MKRGDFITVAMPGDFGKLRPALVILADQFDQSGTVVVLLASGTLVDAPLIRISVQPTAANGLRTPSQVMVDKIMSVKRDKLSAPFGRLEDETMVSVTRSLALFLEVA